MSNIPAWLLSLIPTTPKLWQQAYIGKFIDRTAKRIISLDDRIGATTAGRTMPELDQVLIGSGRHFELAVLYTDICGFSQWPGKDWLARIIRDRSKRSTLCRSSL